jgi:hypothetical protein
MLRLSLRPLERQEFFFIELDTPQKYREMYRKTCAFLRDGIICCESKKEETSSPATLFVTLRGLLKL